MPSQIQNTTLSSTGLLQSVCGWSAVVLVFAAPISRSLFIASGLLFAICWLAEGNYRAKWGLLQSLPVTTPVLVLAMVVLVWSTFSTAPSDAVVQTLKVYSKLPLVLMLMTTFSNEAWQRRAWLAFFVAMFLVLVSTYANVVVDLPWSVTQHQGLGQNHTVFIEHVSQSLTTTVFIAVCVYSAVESRSRVKRWMWLSVALLSLFSILFLLPARSGLVALAVASAVLLVQHIPRRRLMWAVAAMLPLSGLLMAVSPLMRERLVLAYSELVNYKPLELTSLGARIDMWRFALGESLAHPLTGTGAGTYRQLASQHFGHCTWVCEHPHNQYLFFSMEYGLLGLAAFLWLVWRVFVTALRSTNPARAVLFVFVAILAVDSLFNVPLWFRGQSYFFFAMLGLLLATVQDSSSKPTA